MTIKTFLKEAGKSISKHSPAIYTVTGIVGFGATAYTAYKSKDKVEAVVEAIEDANSTGTPIDKMDVVVDLTKALYIPITIGVLSGVSILMAHRIQRNRIMALTGALAAQQAQNLYFENKYKKQHGQKAFEKFVTPTEQEEVEYQTKDGKTKTKVEEVKKDIDGTIGAWYDESQEYAADDHSYNMAYIESAAEILQTRLFQRGSLLLNEVREELGLSRIRSGALLGWTTADSFDIYKTVSAIGREDLGEFRDQIYVSWSKPRYVFDDIEFNDRYAAY